MGPLDELLDQLRAAYGRWVPEQEPPGPASPADLAAVEELFRARGATSLPADLRAFWSHTNGSALGSLVIWRARRADHRAWFEEGVVEAHEHLDGVPAGHVYIGHVGDEHIGYHLATGRIDLFDFLAQPRDGFPNLATLLQVIVTMEGA